MLNLNYSNEGSSLRMAFGLIYCKHLANISGTYQSHSAHNYHYTNSPPILSIA
jgi:hypothetical protein